MQKYATYRPVLLPSSNSVRVISYLSYLSSNSFWKEEVFKTCQQNAATYHHLAGWNEQKSCRVPSTVIGSARSTTVEYRTNSRLLRTFIGLNHVIRLADLLQHLQWKLKGMHDLSKLRKRAKLQIWRQKTQLTIVTYVWSWLRGWTPSWKKNSERLL